MARMPNFIPKLGLSSLKAMRNLHSWFKPHLTFTNTLLVIILFVLFFGFYSSSPKFKKQIDSLSLLGYSYKTEKIDMANMTCVSKGLSAKDRNEKFNDLLAQEKASGNLLTAEIALRLSKKLDEAY